ncbi:hypothetical protein, variant [Saprolegnia diclina VS20]|uniref:PARP16 N-terminal domain-containing protein n=1 Tax=Saprolegnia diclina (strain VS20) TaxID=1156394 RepID=T0S1J2_SAPDV|nr:hypothetical protein, variant [Saprolegnia diclina VS20]EQC36522.1 hypothetical protein, variant [Saprolegnia diclina VS20]|eukprot:XP_008609942.1 hypothetical protein, variant [Saprolegnia diclina VS20]
MAPLVAESAPPREPESAPPLEPESAPPREPESAPPREPESAPPLVAESAPPLVPESTLTSSPKAPRICVGVREEIPLEKPEIVFKMYGFALKAWRHKECPIMLDDKIAGIRCVKCRAIQHNWARHLGRLKFDAAAELTDVVDGPAASTSLFGSATSFAATVRDGILQELPLIKDDQSDAIDVLATIADTFSIPMGSVSVGSRSFFICPGVCADDVGVDTLERFRFFANDETYLVSGSNQMRHATCTKWKLVKAMSTNVPHFVLALINCRRSRRGDWDSSIIEASHLHLTVPACLERAAWTAEASTLTLTVNFAPVADALPDLHDLAFFLPAADETVYCYASNDDASEAATSAVAILNDKLSTPFLALQFVHAVEQAVLDVRADVGNDERRAKAIARVTARLTSQPATCDVMLCLLATAATSPNRLSPPPPMFKQPNGEMHLATLKDTLSEVPSLPELQRANLDDILYHDDRLHVSS